MDSKKEFAPEVPTQKQTRENLDGIEKSNISNDIIKILAINNLSIKQSREILNRLLEHLENIRPWHGRKL